MAENLTLVSSDKQNIEIDVESAKKSDFLSGLIPSSPDQKKPIELDFKSEILKKVVEYLNYYKDKQPKEISKPLPTSNLKELIDEWDYNFINSIELENIFDIINAGNYMGIAPLLDLCHAKLSSVLKEKTLQELRVMFNMECDLSEEEIKLLDEYTI